MVTEWSFCVHADTLGPAAPDVLLVRAGICTQRIVGAARNAFARWCQKVLVWARCLIRSCPTAGATRRLTMSACAAFFLGVRRIRLEKRPDCARSSSTNPPVRIGNVRCGCSAARITRSRPVPWAGASGPCAVWEPEQYPAPHREPVRLRAEAKSPRGAHVTTRVRPARVGTPVKQVLKAIVTANH